MITWGRGGTGQLLQRKILNFVIFWKNCVNFEGKMEILFKKSPAALYLMCADFFFLSNHLGFLADYMGDGGHANYYKGKVRKICYYMGEGVQKNA